MEKKKTTWKKEKALLKGTYRAQARIVAAEDVASAESPMVSIQR